MRFMLMVFAALTAWVSAVTVNLPLHSRATKHLHAARGSTKFHLPVSARQSDTPGVNVPVTDWFSRSDNQWYTTFSVGTPPQDLTAYFDTGNIEFFIPQSNCTTCDNLTLFDADKSTTFSPLPGTESLSYFTTGADSIPLTHIRTQSCRSVHDTVSLAWGALKVYSQSLFLCDQYAGAASKSAISGIMGMGIWDPLANSTPWYWNLVHDGQLESPWFSFYIPPRDLNGGQVTLGGVDESKIDGNITWTSLNTTASHSLTAYTIDQSAIYANGKKLDTAKLNAPAAKNLAILSTGVAFIQTPDYGTAKYIYSQISPHITQIDPAGAWGAPCLLMDIIAPDLTFALGPPGKELNLTIPKEYFNLGEYPRHPGMCQALFNHPAEGGQMYYGGAAVWMVGSPLLDKYYTVWDGVGLRLGWGKLPGLPGFNGSEST